MYVIREAEGLARNKSNADAGLESPESKRKVDLLQVSRVIEASAQ